MDMTEWNIVITSDLCPYIEEIENFDESCLDLQCAHPLTLSRNCIVSDCPIRTKIEWIKINDRFPMVPSMQFIPQPTDATQRCLEFTEQYRALEAGHADYRATHWILLPELPKEDEDGIKKL